MKTIIIALLALTIFLLGVIASPHITKYIEDRELATKNEECALMHPAEVVEPMTVEEVLALGVKLSENPNYDVWMIPQALLSAKVGYSTAQASWNGERCVIPPKVHNNPAQYQKESTDLSKEEIAKEALL